MDNEFISLFRVVAERKFDAIIPIKRKGAAVLRRVKLMNVIPQLEQIRVLDSDHLVEEDVRGKRIAIFDDAIASGATVNTILQKVKKLKPKYVCIVTLVARSPTNIPLYARHRTKPRVFNEWMKKRLRYYFQLGFPLDADHLVISYELEHKPNASFINVLKKCVKGVGRFQPVSKAKGTEMTTIEVNPKIIYGCLPKQLPDFLYRFDACKVRIYVDGDLLSVVPIANPVVLASKRRGKCPKSMPICLSTYLDGKQKASTIGANQRLCLDCLIIHSSTCLARLFCGKLQTGMRQCRFILKPLDITWDEMENKYKEVEDLLERLKTENASKERAL